jgi:hypothetical protein
MAPGAALQAWAVQDWWLWREEELPNLNRMLSTRTAGFLGAELVEEQSHDHSSPSVRHLHGSPGPLEARAM